MELLNIPDPSSLTVENLQMEPQEIKNMENIQALTLLVYPKNFIVKRKNFIYDKSLVIH